MKPPTNYLKGPVPYDVISCGECDGLDCDKCSLYDGPKEPVSEDNRQAQMQREDENNYLLYPERI